MPQVFEIKIDNLPQLTKAMTNYPNIAGPVLRRALLGTKFIFEQNTKRNDPVPFKSGNLVNSFNFFPSFAKDAVAWGPTANYASAVEFGTKPHVILPVKARMLSWLSGSGARYVTSSSGRRYHKAGKTSRIFARKVNHPGTKAQPFMNKIAKKSEPDVLKLFGSAGDIIMRDIARQTI